MNGRVEGLNPGPPNYKSDALASRPRYLPVCFKGIVTVSMQLSASLSYNCINLYTDLIVKLVIVLSPQDPTVMCLDIHAIGVLHTRVIHQLMDTVAMPTLLSVAPRQVKTF